MVFVHASPMTFDIAKLRGFQLTPLMMFLIFAGMIAKSATFPCTLAPGCRYRAVPSPVCSTPRCW